MEHVFYFEFELCVPITETVAIHPRAEVCVVADIEPDQHSKADWNIAKFWLRREALRSTPADVEIPFWHAAFPPR